MANFSNLIIFSFLYISKQWFQKGHNNDVMDRSMSTTKVPVEQVKAK